MPETIDLSGDITIALTGAYQRGNPVVVGYTDDDGKPSLSIRGSVHVHSKNQVAIWARSRDTGLAAALQSKPDVSLIFFASNELGPKMLLSVRGIGRVDPSQNEGVYSSISDTERDHDPEANGVAVIVDVTEVQGFSPEVGPFLQSAS